MNFLKMQRGSTTSIHCVVTLFLVLAPTLSHASLMYYTFEGIVTGFQSYHSGLGIDDFDVVVGETAVKYVFEVDFEANTEISGSSGGTYYYFHTETLSGSIINGMDREPFYRGFNLEKPSNSMAQITGSRLDVRIQTNENITENWRVQDWVVGQNFSSIDLGCFAGGASGCAVYAFGDVTLTAINGIPEPSALMLFALGLFVVGRFKGNG